jgi:hypothetical protein
MLTIRNSSNLPVHTPPTGPKAIYISTLGPVGGVGAGHALRVAGDGARVVR